MSAEAGASAITTWSTCPPGLEEFARDEALEALADLKLQSAEASRGRLVCQLAPQSLGQLKRVLDLRIPANHFLVFHDSQLKLKLGEGGDNGAPLTKESAINQLIGLIHKADWRLAMEAWRLFFHDPTGRHREVTHVGHEPQPAPTLPTVKVPRDPSRLNFRCTCYRGGGPHAFQSMEAAAAVGAALQDHFGWNVDLKDFDVEVVLWIEGNLARLCLSLNRQCMDFRGQLVALGSTALRSTIAAGMLRLGRPAPGEIVCDCVCGSGTIPVEAWTSYPAAWHLAGDCHPAAVDKTLANVEHWCQRSTERVPVAIARWDLRYFPLRPSSVDLFLADLPFGKRLGSKRENRDLYPTALTAMARATVPGTGRACLLSADRANLSRAMRQLSDHWTLTKAASVGIGGITASLVLLTRTLAAAPGS